MRRHIMGPTEPASETRIFNGSLVSSAPANGLWRPSRIPPTRPAAGPISGLCPHPGHAFIFPARHLTWDGAPTAYYRS